ncbi:MAG: aminotransferase class I/II-fold pyridoxal phosphate-dependent enzyme [Candidatus Dojkabacteria bacterium]|nr:aminotransferase class I/II-fold pyridoxal phosphate-dependent enzyme [Candidatus Dojkabacteria bacterium]MDQ7020660.1 aminotransferase class I/II-fold pyridoxal phosphate-dependent enzyme [Candidatus Dojkabacteria bacterium]
MPYNNPTGNFLRQPYLDSLSEICASNNIWLISDEAYRGLNYTGEENSTIWKTKNNYENKISIDSASKLWNACGLRIGALVTNNQQLHNLCVAEYTANLCTNVLGQKLFAVINDLSESEIKDWIESLKKIYFKRLNNIRNELLDLNNDLIISKPESSLYLIIDVKKAVNKDFSAKEFALYCAEKGKI